MADQPGSQNLRARPEQHEEQAFDHLGQAFRPLPSTSTTTIASPSHLAGTIHTSHHAGAVPQAEAQSPLPPSGLQVAPSSQHQAASTAFGSRIGSSPVAARTRSSGVTTASSVAQVASAAARAVLQRPRSTTAADPRGDHSSDRTTAEPSSTVGHAASPSSLAERAAQGATGMPTPAQSAAQLAAQQLALPTSPSPQRLSLGLERAS